MRPQATDTSKMNVLIKRKDSTSRAELHMHWFKNHMPAVIAAQDRAKEQNRPYARRYIAQLFDEERRGRDRWDGMAQLWFPDPQRPAAPNPNARPSDTFQEKSEPYGNWSTREYVVMDGEGKLSTEPLTLNEPYPSTRSGFYRINFLVPSKPGTDYEELFDHWLDVHVPNVADTMKQVDGFRYVVSHSVFPDQAPYAGMAELYFERADGFQEYNRLIKPDGMEKWVDGQELLIFSGSTEMIGIP